ncbi:Nn.00g097020.m01.CDS01 [Neocucurbitaria sp. VM-36]
MPLHARIAPRSRSDYVFFFLNILAAICCRILLTVATLDFPWGEPDWTTDAAVFLLTKSSRRGIVFLIRFIAAYLFVFAATCLAGFQWLELDEYWIGLWGPEDLQEQVNRDEIWWW